MGHVFDSKGYWVRTETAERVAMFTPEPDDTDDLAAPRGIAVAVMLGLAMWAAAFAFILL